MQLKNTEHLLPNSFGHSTDHSKEPFAEACFVWWGLPCGSGGSIFPAPEPSRPDEALLSLEDDLGEAWAASG